LGGKIIWNLYENHRHPVSNLLKKKKSQWHLYEKPPGSKHPQRNLNLESLQAQIRTLSEASISNPREWKKTMLWQDNIMGNSPLIESEDIMEIHTWLSQRGINKLADISAWDDSGR
jgi:hypothetical protein